MNARLGEFKTPHGVIKLPGFMNVATCGAIKGAVSAVDLKNIKSNMKEQPSNILCINVTY